MIMTTKTTTTGDSSSQQKPRVSRRTFLAGSGMAAAGLALPQVAGRSSAYAMKGRIPEFEVSHGHSVGYIWHIPKDSPDGKKVNYITFPGGNPGPGRAPAELWYASPRGTNRTKIADIGPQGNHTGAIQQWIDNETIVYLTREAGDDESDWFPRVIDIQGNILHNFSSHPAGLLPIHYHDRTRKLLAGSRVATLTDVWILDPFTGDEEKVLDASAFTPWQNIIGGNPEEWRIWHRYFNPAGTLIWVKVVHAGAEFAFTFNTSGEDIVYWDSERNPRGHPTWWDDTRIWHHGPNRGGPLLSRIYNRDGSVSVDTPQSGPSNHGGLSPNRELISGESSRPISPDVVDLWLYERENTTPLETLYSVPHASIVWDDNAHINVSFSRDGKRVYANKPVSENSMRLVMYDISRYARGGRWPNGSTERSPGTA